MKRMTMNFAIAAGLISAAVLTAASTTAASAMTKSREWCAIYRGGSENCGFQSEAQCTATVSGTGGFCRMSYYDNLLIKRRG
jgi:Protein of unknown function (DUF3551)